MNKKNFFYLVLMSLVCWSPLMTENLSAQPPSSFEQESPFPDDNPVQIVPDRVTAPVVTPQSDTQMIMINSRYAGWEEASRDGEKRVSDDLRGNWIMVDSNGRMEGQVIPGEGADVARMNVFLMNRGRLVKQTSLDDTGRFEFQNVRQGAYSLIGWGDKGFFAFGMNILAQNPKVTGVGNRLKITAYQNRTTINTDWIKHFSARVNYRVFGRYPTGESASDTASLYGFVGLSNNPVKSVPATSISSHRVARTADGLLIGRIHQLNSISGRPVDVRTTKVMLFQGDNVVASTTTDNFGVFEFREVPNGSYAVTAAGVDGVGLIGITVGGDEEAINDAGEFVNEAHPIDFTLVSSETMGWLNHYANEVAYRRALLTPRPVVAEAPAPYFGNGACPNCQNKAGGCSTCQNAYLLSVCRSRGLTFEQWQQHCQGVDLPSSLNIKNIGNGDILRRAADQIRKNSQKVNSAFDKAFYPDTTSSQLQQLNNSVNQGQLQNSPYQNYAPQQNFAPQIIGPPPAIQNAVPSVLQQGAAFPPIVNGGNLTNSIPAPGEITF